MPNHIPFSRLADLVEGRLTPDEQVEMLAHIATCPGCAAEMAWLERVIGRMRTYMIEQPPAHAVAAAKRMFRSPLRVTRQQFMAALRFDSAHMPLGLGRRAGAQTERQLLFAISSYLLDLRLAPQGSLWVISGQLLGTNEGEQIELDGPAGTAQAMLNVLSEFALPPTPPGTYTLRLELTDFDITVDGLEVGAWDESG